jgi:hypothetical protein
MIDGPNILKVQVTEPHGGANTSAVDTLKAADVQEFSGLDSAKPMKTGRPKLPAGTAKGRIVHVLFTPEEIERLTASAKASDKTISEWIRSTVNAAIESRES